MNLNLQGIDQIVGAERFDEPSGVQLVLSFANGSKLMICPENDIINYMAPGGSFGDGGASVLCEMGAGMHEGPLERV